MVAIRPAPSPDYIVSCAEGRLVHLSCSEETCEKDNWVLQVHCLWEPQTQVGRYKVTCVTVVI
jgi:hypothetical protein